MTLRIGSLFSGFGGIDLAVEQILDAEVAWVCDVDPAASKVLAHRYPGVPNLGDITTVDWDAVEPVDIITGGSPCQDVSSAGRRAGMRPGTRSGLWTSMADAVDQLRPSLVLFENVRGLLSAKAHSDLEPCPWHLGGSGDGEPALRALGRVLGDLADIGFDAEWTGLRASDVGAPHHRYRIFLAAWPSDVDPSGRRRRPEGQQRRVGAAERGEDVADSVHEGGLGPGLGRRLRAEPADGDQPAADAEDLRLQRGGRHGDGGLDLRTAVAALVPHADGAAGGERRVAASGQAEAGGARSDARGRGGASDPVAADGAVLPTPTAADAERTSLTMARGNPTLLGAVRPLPAASALLPTPRATDGTKGGPNQRGSSGDLMLPSAVAHLPTPRASDTGTPGRRASDGFRPPLSQVVLPLAVDWGPFAAAIARWEAVMDRPAPDPRDERGRLAPAFVEWMLGLDAGWVTDVPGLSRSDLLRILGNGVVRQQCAAALPGLLAARAAALAEGGRAT